MIILYDLLYIIFLIIYLPFFIIKKKFHKNFTMRLGIFPKDVINKMKDKEIIWIHAVSVGEVNSAIPIIKGLRSYHRDKLIIISTVTQTGNQTAQNIAEQDELVIYLPLDLSFIVKKIVRLIKPKIFIIVETEIWPNLIFALANKNIPVAMVNGRISPSSFRGYKIIKPLIKPVFGKVNLFCMQTKEDALKIISLGAESDNVKITGNTKFDIGTKIKKEKQDINELAKMLKLEEGDKLIVAGSTHHPEEKTIFSCYRKLLKKEPGLKLIIAPRHIQRTKIIEREAREFGFKINKFSNIYAGSYSKNKKSNVILLDVMGKLKDLYALSDIVFIGGSLARIGGHNMIEAAVYSKPIIFGPYVFNFQSIADDLLTQNAAYQIRNEKELFDKIKFLIKHPIERKKLGDNAYNVLLNSKGASRKNLGFVNQLMYK